MPDNTNTDWGAHLLRLADEAEHDAGEHDSSLVLAETLKDLAHVARAYAGRLGVERTGKVREVATADGVGFVDMLLGAEIPPHGADIESLRTAVAELRQRVDLAPSASMADAAPPAELPEWLLSTLANHHERMVALEARVTDLEARAQFGTVAPGLWSLDPVDTVVDEDRDQWDSIVRARAALRGMVVREHRDRSAIRQKVLERVASLARRPDIGSDAAANAELRQHEARAQELAEIDVIVGVKLDEIAALDDLEIARSYNTKEGWPS